MAPPVFVPVVQEDAVIADRFPFAAQAAVVYSDPAVEIPIADGAHTFH